MATLREAFDQCFLVGTALDRWQIDGQRPGILPFAASQYSVVTAENAMKWERIHPQPGEYSFEIPDKMVAFAEANDMAVIGHTLVWHSQAPDWIFEDGDGTPATREQVLARMEEHITTVMGRYKGRVLGWDVVNEAILDDGAFRSSKWRETVGPDYIEKAFEIAHRIDPEAELYYNDYSMYQPGKRDAVVAMVKDMQARGIPIHGIGMQGHFGLGRPTMEQFTAALDAYGALGLKVMITELDVSVLPPPQGLGWGADISQLAERKDELDPYTGGLPADVAAEQAERYAALFRELVARKDYITRVTFWGVGDGDSWKNNFPVRGRTDYTLLFDRSLQPKPAFEAVIAEAENCAGD